MKDFSFFQIMNLFQWAASEMHTRILGLGNTPETWDNMGWILFCTPQNSTSYFVNYAYHITKIMTAYFASIFECHECCLWNSILLFELDINNFEGDGAILYQAKFIIIT